MLKDDLKERLKPIETLSDMVESPADVNGLLLGEFAAGKMFEGHGLPPTVGCEVEVKWSSLFPELAHKYFGEQDIYGKFERKYRDLSDDQKSELDELSKFLDRTLKPRYESTVIMGIPAGSDAYWEFANAPTYHWKTLATEVGLLFDVGLIPTGYDHSLHVTVGGLRESGGGMGLILAGLELQFVSAERILHPTIENNFGTAISWDRRGHDGLRERHIGELALGQTIATEMRTLTVSSKDDAHQILKSSQMLAACLCAYRLRKQDSSDAVQVLATYWTQYRELMRNIFDVSELPIASWGTPRYNPDHWRKWADTIDARGQLDNYTNQIIRQIEDTVTQVEDYLELLNPSH